MTAVMKDVFALQDQITEKIVSALAVKLSGREKEWSAEKGTENVAAYDAFLRGYVHYLRLTPDDFAKAAASLNKAIELDPNYGRAYAALSAVYYEASKMPPCSKAWESPGMKPVFGHFNTCQGSEGSQSRIPSNPGCISSGASIRKRSPSSNGPSALDPNDPACHLHMGNTLTLAGKPKEGVEFHQERDAARSPQPGPVFGFSGGSPLLHGGNAGGGGFGREGHETQPGKCPVVGAWLASFYALVDRDQEARALIETWKKEKYDSPASSTCDTL